MNSIAAHLVDALYRRGVRCVFGIPGVHTLALYRALAHSDIRHITARHEQGAGFMADGYARVSGKPGVACVITGPGLTNILTPMAQARGDSVPLLVISAVNTLGSLGRGLGHLHELPDQRALARQVALVSERVEAPEDLEKALERAFAPFSTGRPGPTHIEIPLDVAPLQGMAVPQNRGAVPQIPPDEAQIAQAARLLSEARMPIILVGGGALGARAALIDIAEKLDAPVVQTVNARGIMFAHPLGIPASPSLEAVRAVIAAADVVLAVGTEMGATDYDMYATGKIATTNKLIRIDICAKQLARHAAELAIHSAAEPALNAMAQNIMPLKKKEPGKIRVGAARQAAMAELDEPMRANCEILKTIRQSVPGAIVVGDSTDPIYAGNLYYDHDRPGGWFNAATGFGALGYGTPAAIGAQLAAPNETVICIVGDGGAQFSLCEIKCAVDENLPIVFIVWNNHGYQEIALAMQAEDIPILGCDPTPPDFEFIARSFNLPFWRVAPSPDDIAQVLRDIGRPEGPCLVEVNAPNRAHGKRAIG